MTSMKHSVDGTAAAIVTQYALHALVTAQALVLVAAVTKATSVTPTRP